MKKAMLMLAVAAVACPISAMAREGGVYHYHGYHHWHDWHNGGVVVFGAPYYGVYDPYYDPYYYPPGYPAPYPYAQQPPAPPAGYQPNAADNGYCREYNETAVVDGRRQQVHGTACMQPDGSWKKMD